jgi:hypothetical protein
MLKLVHNQQERRRRAVELANIERINDSENARCYQAVVVDQKIVVFITSHHKGFGMSQSENSAQMIRD